MTVEAKALIAEAVSERLGAVADRGDAKLLPPWSKKSLRKMAVIVRQFNREIRAGLLDAINSKSRRAGEMIAELMIIWTDIPYVTDGAMQEVLRKVEADKLTLALYEAEEEIMQKIRSNLSEQAVAALDEQTSLLTAPGEKDIEDARDHIVRVVREINEISENVFMEDGFI
jgi:flagellar motor switch protein FliG